MEEAGHTQTRGARSDILYSRHGPWPAAAESEPPIAKPTANNRPLVSRHPFLLALIVLLACACSRRDAARATEDGHASDGAPVLALERFDTAYRAVQLASSGSIRGRVEVIGTLPSDTIVHPISDHAVCGESFLNSTLDGDGVRLAGAVVWLTGVRAGKPLPLTRLFLLTHTHCLLSPRTQAALVGGTLNLRNDDPLGHRARFLRYQNPEPLKLVSHTGDGQVVPVEDVLTQPGLLEVRCDLHPWTRAWIAVFDHPYFMVTERNGAFSLDSVPPGRYRVAAWHERFGSTEDSVTVPTNGKAELTLTFKP